MGRAAVSFLAGLGAGGLKEYQREQDQERQARLDQMAQETHDVQMREAKRREDEQMALSNAAQPATVNEGAGGVTKPDYADNRDVGQPGEPGGEGGPALAQGVSVNGQAYPTAAAGQAAADTYNSDDATSKRIALAYRKSGDPMSAMNYGTKALQAKGALQEYADKQWDRAVRQAVPGGHDALAKVMTGSEAGPFAGKKVEAVPSEDGKNVTYAIVNPDGTKTPTKFTFSNDEEGSVRAAYMLANVPPEVRYTHMINEEKTQAAAKLKVRELELRQRELEEVKVPTAEAKVALAETKAELAKMREQAGDGKVSREERLRYTTLFTDAGRRMQDAQKALNTMRGDRSFMKRSSVPGSPEAQQLADAQSQLKQHSEERETWRGLLASGTPKPAAAGPAAAPASDGPKRITSQAERDALPAGTRYIAPDGQTYIKQ
jgi:hypothetical protein